MKPDHGDRCIHKCIINTWIINIDEMKQNYITSQVWILYIVVSELQFWMFTHCQDVLWITV
jgi:hypothetical protein